MIRSVLATTLLVGFVSVASAQTATIPSPSNPTPDFPVATDGSPLPPDVTGSPRAFASRADALPAFDAFFAVPRSVGDR